MICPNCDEMFDTEALFGDNVECPNCGSLMSTDWDYVNDSAISQWAVEILRKGPGGEK